MQALAEGLSATMLHATPEPEEYRSLVNVWRNRNCASVPGNYGDVFQDSPLLLAMLNSSPCVIKVLNLCTQQYEFVSDNVFELFGYSKNEFLQHGLSFSNTIAHPEDLQHSWKLIKKIWDFILHVPLAEQVQYKFSYDFRIVKPCGKVVRVLAQNSVLQTDSHGNITHVLIVYSDISHLKKHSDVATSFISSGTSVYHFTSVEDNKAGSTIKSLSKRELEIVKLMSEGYSSKLIADKLFISFHTVNTHRQKIMEKTNTHNTGGLVQYAVSQGLV
ncbi:PAS domain-containing protein [Pontibacter qinzhouensis]|uniref:PAS domain-containing protein n=1 Tax=Pontibacter qinzhouensis TaxID=2603253 RepID=A0A5C8KCY8_9BACT|nr:LuxR C-terminal-related transcriptional regulator [Pontibacter qinzhouensis]TXK52142.1 PAS domain-containing protein [Pontibacter qinzhouensis]